MENYRSEQKYLLALLTEKKSAEKKAAGLIKDAELWKGRIALAEENGRNDLAGKARTVLSDTLSGIHALYAEMARLDKEIETARGDTADAKIDDERIISRASTDALLKQMEALAPEEFRQRSTMDRELRELDAEGDLEELKNKLRGEE